MDDWQRGLMHLFAKQAIVRSVGSNPMSSAITRNNKDMILIVKKLANGKYRAYFDRMPNFYGEGNTRQESIDDLIEKTYAVLRAIANIQHGE